MILNLNFFLHSFKARITLFTLGILLIGIWATTYYASQMLREDMRHLLGAQQVSVAQLLANDINNEMNLRFNALNVAAAQISSVKKKDAEKLSMRFEPDTHLENLFNAGIRVIDLSDISTVNFPFVPAKTSMITADDDEIYLLKAGKRVVTRPFIDKQSGKPSLAVIVPIKDKQNQIIGGLAGIIDLSVLNFLDDLTQNRYSQTGYFLLVAPRYRMIITASEKSRVMENLPAKGVNPFIDEFIDGYEGPAETFSPQNVNMLASAKPVVAAHWYVCVLLPIHEAYAPIRAMQYRMFLTSLLVSLIMAVAVWLMLRHELSPLRMMLENITKWSNNPNDMPLFPTFNCKEIDTLAGGFNHLLNTLHSRKKDLKLLVEQERQHRVEQSRFLAMLAHELKSPLAAIEFATKNIERSTNRETREQSLQHIRAITRDMTAITERCIQADKLEQKNPEIHLSTFSVENCCQEIINALNCHNRITLDVPTNLLITSDEFLYRMVVNNLIENAIKYSPPQSMVPITVKLETTEPLGVVMSVCNEIGKAGKPDAGKVFEKYYRSTCSQYVRGTGLGTWLAKGIAQTLGGTVNYIEHKDKVEFQLWLPR